MMTTTPPQPADYPPGARVEVRPANGLRIIGTVEAWTYRDGQPWGLIIGDAEVHNPADPSVVPHKDQVRFWLRTLDSIRPAPEA